jgi:hypothetical protein
MHARDGDGMMRPRPVPARCPLETVMRPFALASAALTCMLVLLLGASAAAHAAAPVETSPTARQMSRAVVSGIRIGAEKGLVDGTLAREVHDCVMNMDQDALAPTYQKLMRERMSAMEISVLDEFYDSDTGRRHYQWSLNQLRTQQGMALKVPMDLSEEEIKRAERMHAQGPGKKLSDISDGTDTAAAAVLKQDIQALVATCRK